MESISAFAAYSAKGKTKPKTTAKKSKDTKKKSPAKKTNGKQKTTGAKSSKSTQQKKTGTAKMECNGNVCTLKKAPSCSNSCAKSKTTTTKAAKKKSTVKKTATKKPQSKKSAASKSAGGGIREDEVDKLVEELMGDSPSNPKKLTEAQKKKRKELEEYLVQQLENMGSDSEEYTDSDCETDSEDFSGSETEYSDSQFEDEYTINTSYDDDETGIATKSESEDSEVDYERSKKNKNAAQKRKSDVMAATTSKGKPTETSAKKSKNGEGPFQKLTKPRQSLNPPLNLPLNSTPKQTAVAEVVKPFVNGNIKAEPSSPPISAVKINSITEGKKIFEWLISPITTEAFFDKYWEKSSYLIKRAQNNYFSHLISFDAIDEMLINNHVEFTKNIDVTSYKNGVRETLNPEGRAMPPVVWDHYGQGCSIRLLNPHTFLPGLFSLNTTLQEYFHCLVGANAYLTPPNSQGFAPHYDDIEAFVLQVEGRKRWRIYKPRSTAEALPRYSSPNFSQDEIGTPIMDQVLEPGDVMYFPRGTIHQACTEPGYHSLHITLSVYQKQSYADLFELMMPMIVQRAIVSNLDMRRGLPLHMWQHAGIAFNNNDTQERAEFIKTVTKLLGQCLREVTMSDVMDAAVDQLAKKFQHEALPPEILPNERIRTVFGSRNHTNENGQCVCDYDIDIRTNVRPLRANIMRLVEEEEKIRIYYYLDNSKEYCEYEPNFIEIEAKEAASVEILIKSYPEYVSVSQLPLDNDEEKIQVVTALWERGLLMMEKPFH